MKGVTVGLNDEAHIVGNDEALCGTKSSLGQQAVVSVDDYIGWSLTCDACRKIYEEFEDGVPEFSSITEEIDSDYGRSREEIAIDEGLSDEVINHGWGSRDSTKFAALTQTPVIELIELNNARKGDKVDLYCDNCYTKLWRDFHLHDFVSVIMECDECGSQTTFEAETYIPPRGAFDVEEGRQAAILRVLSETDVSMSSAQTMKMYPGDEEWRYHQSEKFEDEIVTYCGYPVTEPIRVVDDNTLTAEECGNCGRTRIQRARSKT